MQLCSLFSVDRNGAVEFYDKGRYGYVSWIGSESPGTVDQLLSSAVGIDSFGGCVVTFSTGNYWVGKRFDMDANEEVGLKVMKPPFGQLYFYEVTKSSKGYAIKRKLNWVRCLCGVPFHRWNVGVSFCPSCHAIRDELVWREGLKPDLACRGWSSEINQQEIARLRRLLLVPSVERQVGAIWSDPSEAGYEKKIEIIKSLRRYPVLGDLFRFCGDLARLSHVIQIVALKSHERELSYDRARSLGLQFRKTKDTSVITRSLR